MLHRLDRLTLDEARTTAAQTLEVVHGLVNNLKELMSGEWIIFCPISLPNVYLPRWASVDRWHSERSWSVFPVENKLAFCLIGF